MVIHNIEPLADRAVIITWRPEVVLDLFLELRGNSYTNLISNLIAKDLNIFLRIWSFENKVRGLYEK